MEKSTIASELALDRWDVSRENDEREESGLEIFRLSGGVLAPTTTRTSNRIDGLLGHMLLQQGSAKYLGDIDKNLDFLYTSLQLDLIERVANDVAAAEPIEEEEIDIPKAIPEDPLIPLDRVRSSV